MTNVNWDEVLQEADDSPRSILAECLARADEITNLLVIFHDKDGRQHEYTCLESAALGIAMLNRALFTAVKEVNEGDGR